MARSEEEERVNELKLQLSQERGSWALLCDDPAASPEDLARVASSIQSLEAQLVILGADLHAPPAAVAPEARSGEESAAAGSPELERCKAAFLALAEADRQQLVRWIAHVMARAE